MKALAKVNLTLEVFGVRADGYHGLRSLVAPISLADEVLLERSSADDFVLVNELPTGDFNCPNDSNLAIKAVELMRRLSGRSEPLRLTLIKRIPLGGGLGGGSADAAAVINELNEFWHMDFTRERLAEAGAELGSDVPALVLGGAVTMEGRGERVRREAAARQFHLALVFPGVSSSTREVYDHVIPRLTSGGEIVDNIRNAFASGSPELLASALENDLEAAAMALHPEIAHARSSLLEAGALGALMTGSGSCVFGVARDAAHAEELVGKLKAAGAMAQTAHTCPVM